MMSEGGIDAVESMFEGVDLHQKKMLDIGFGLGGIEFYLAETYQANVTGVELNAWMTEEATRRTPAHLKSLVNFVTYKNPPELPFEKSEFDIIFSKGVLTHLHDKQPLFQEVFRALKQGGIFIVDDWLSPFQDQWGDRIQRMCEIENLTLYAETQENYRRYLELEGFSDIIMRNENQQYAKYNQDIVDHLKSETYAKTFIKTFGEQSWSEAIEGYQLIADSMTDNELLVTLIACTKKPT